MEIRELAVYLKSNKYMCVSIDMNHKTYIENGMETPKKSKSGNSTQ